MDRRTLIKKGVMTSNVGADSVPRSWLCQVVSGPDSGCAVALGARPVLIGAADNCDLILTDPAVSRRHLELSIGERGLVARDLNSTNGSFYLGSRLSELVIPEGGCVSLGDSELRLLREQASTLPPSERRRFGGLVGHGVHMRELFAVLELVSPTDVTVLIEGESGTGKELVAQALHDHSARAAGPFVVFDCGAASEQLIESQLFGHLRGAFTGAEEDRAGAFAQAHGGTLFLDEIGELPVHLQPKLLRALEARSVQPLGAARPHPVDIRVLAATHRQLAQQVTQGRFRFDLLQRLAVVHAKLAPLRERREDIPALVAYFYEAYGADPGPIDGVNLQRLLAHDWPGNVRELRNVLDRARVLCAHPSPAFADLEVIIDPGTEPSDLVDVTLPYKEAKERCLRDFEQRYIATLFATCDGNISEAARRSGINRNHFRKLLLKHQLLTR